MYVPVLGEFDETLTIDQKLCQFLIAVANFARTLEKETSIFCSFLFLEGKRAPNLFCFLSLKEIHNLISLLKINIIKTKAFQSPKSSSLSYRASGPLDQRT